MHTPGKGQALSTSPARQPPASSTLAALSGVMPHPLCSTVLWPGSCPVRQHSPTHWKRSSVRVSIHGVRGAPANLICESWRTDHALPKIDGRKQNTKEKGLVWHETYSQTEPLSLDKPFLAESSGVCLPVKHSSQEHPCAPKAPSTVCFTFLR